MTKRLNAKIGTYQKDGQTKGRYASLGVIIPNDSGEFILLDPTVDLGGVLMLQNQMAASEGKPQRDRVMVSIFSDENQRQQGGGQSSGGGYSQQSGGYGGGQMDDSEIPF